MRAGRTWLAAVAVALGVTASACRDDAAKPPQQPVAASSVAAEEPAAGTAAPSAPAASSPTSATTDMPGADSLPASAPTVGLDGVARPMPPHTDVAVTVAILGAASAADAHALAGMRHAFDACANQAPGTAESARMVVDVVIAPQGGVRSAHVVRNRGFSSDAVACMTERLRGARFDPARRARTVKIGIIQTIERP